MFNEDLKKVLMKEMVVLPWGRDGRGEPVQFLSEEGGSCVSGF